MSISLDCRRRERPLHFNFGESANVGALDPMTGRNRKNRAAGMVEVEGTKFESIRLPVFGFV